MPRVRVANGTPIQYSCLENPMDGGAWRAAVHGVAKSRTQLSDFTFTFRFHALEKEMATHSSVLAWRIPGTEEPGGLPSMGSHRVGHNWSHLAAAAAAACCYIRPSSLSQVHIDYFPFCERMISPHALWDSPQFLSFLSFQLLLRVWYFFTLHNVSWSQTFIFALLWIIIHQEFWNTIFFVNIL